MNPAAMNLYGWDTIAHFIKSVLSKRTTAEDTIQSRGFEQIKKPPNRRLL
jgi:hypothetical protein